MAPGASGSWAGQRIVVTGGAGFLGGALVDRLRAEGADDVRVPRRAAHDLRRPEACAEALDGADVVFHLAATVGGIAYNLAHPADLLHDNLLMGLQVLEAARRADTARVVLASSACAYPGDAPVPTPEDALWGGPPEPSNGPYGVAKRALVDAGLAYARQHGMKVTTLIPTNLFGPRDAFGSDRAHVIPALMARFHAAKQAGAPEVVCWGDGTPTRDFLYVEDAAALFAKAPWVVPDAAPVNLGTGREVSIRATAEAIRDAVGYPGALRWDPSKPGGQRRRALSTKRMEALFGPFAFTPLEEGLRRTYASYLGALPRAQGAGA